MVRRSLVVALMGIALLGTVSLAGLGGCTVARDEDGDGWCYPPGAFLRINCHLKWDCDDTNPDINPSVLEGPDGDAVCGDELDNDCDDNIDMDDLGCVECIDGDSDGYGGNASENCSESELDCNDEDGDINPGIFEGPEGDPVCGDGIDNDCDEDVDGNDAWCLPEMVTIPAGCFEMGGPTLDKEKPIHTVCITSAFDMDILEVTNGQYQLCADAGVCDPPNYLGSYGRDEYFGNPEYDRYPVVHVDWNHAYTYCEWAGKRLPTEAEYEYAARGGLTDSKYPWGDEISCDDANHERHPWGGLKDDCAGDGLPSDTHEGGSYAPNGYGLYDIAGNVAEWVSDWYDFEYYQYCVDNGIVDDPQGPDTGNLRGRRGGSYANSEDYLRVYSRHGDDPTASAYNWGFRCVQ